MMYLNYRVVWSTRLLEIGASRCLCLVWSIALLAREKLAMPRGTRANSRQVVTILRLVKVIFYSNTGMKVKGILPMSPSESNLLNYMAPYMIT